MTLIVTPQLQYSQCILQLQMTGLIVVVVVVGLVSFFNSIPIFVEVVVAETIWFDWVLWHNNAKSSSYIYIKYIWFVNTFCW